MNKIPYEVYKAFAGTKPTEFDSFYRDWLRNMPEPEEVTIIEPAPKKARKRKPKPKVVENSIVFEPETPEEEAETERAGFSTAAEHEESLEEIEESV